MTSSSHKIPKYDWRWTGGGWRGGWLGLVITDESLRTSVIWIYTIVWAYKRTKYTIPTARGADLDWPWRPCPSLTCPGKKNINPTWHVTLYSHIFADVLYDCHESYFWWRGMPHGMWLLIFWLLVVMFLWALAVFLGGWHSYMTSYSHILGNILHNMTWWSNIFCDT